MFRISEKQLNALKEVGADRYHERLCDFIVAEFKVQDARRPALEKGITAAIEDARGFDLKGEKAVATYSVAAFMIGLGIKDDPKLCAALSSPSLSEARKVEWLSDWLSALETALETSADG